MKRYPKSPQVKVVVDREIIAGAEVRDSSHCMIAEAVKKAVPGAKSVSIDLQTIRFTDKEKSLRYTYLTPRSAAVALISFDQGQHTEPFDFVLRNAHVTAASASKHKRYASSERTEAQKKALEKATKAQKLLSKKGLRSPDNGSATSIRVPVGGQPPPRDTSTFARRRAFGLRALAR